MKSNQYQAILGAIEKMGITEADITRKNTSVFDEFHVRGRAVSEELFSQIELNKDSLVLDLGCGLGGTCRMIAEKFNCIVHGIDNSDQHIETAKFLSKLIGLNGKTLFKQGDATNLPYSSNHFDLIITQHVQMCIADKGRFYSEVKRVLKKDGRFVYYDVFKKSDDVLNYPLPWVDEAANNHLITSSQLKEQLQSLGFNKILSQDQTQKGTNFLSNFLSKAEDKPAILTGQKILMGNNAFDKITNLYKALKDGVVGLESGVYQLGIRN